MVREITLATDGITLGQLLKLAKIVSSGGEAKLFLKTTPVKVNGEAENRRGRKLRDGDVVEIAGVGRLVVRRSS